MMMLVLVVSNEAGKSGTTWRFQWENHQTQRRIFQRYFTATGHGPYHWMAMWVPAWDRFLLLFFEVVFHLVEAFESWGCGEHLSTFCTTFAPLLQDFCKHIEGFPDPQWHTMTHSSIPWFPSWTTVWPKMARFGQMIYILGSLRDVISDMVDIYMPRNLDVFGISNRKNHMIFSQVSCSLGPSSLSQVGGWIKAWSPRTGKKWPRPTRNGHCNGRTPWLQEWDVQHWWSLMFHMLGHSSGVWLVLSRILTAVWFCHVLRSQRSWSHSQGGMSSIHPSWSFAPRIAWLMALWLNIHII